MSSFNKYFQIAKVDEEKQSVWGYASTPTLDSDDEIVSLEAIKAALPDYLEWANIREMHKNSAVGVALVPDVQVDDIGLWIGARIIDPLAWQKVKEKVYKGFSIGGNIIKKVGKVIKEMTLVEISLVDRPANPDCKIEVVKRASDTEEWTKGTGIVLLSKANTGEIDFEQITTEEATNFRKWFGGLFRMFKAGDGLSSPAGHVETLNPDGHSDHPHLGLLPSIPQNMPEPGAIGEKDADNKPYGDVDYADPGYQTDGKKRYPVDTPKHIRAAWNYIHKPGNRTGYTAEQLTHIEHKIIAAWKSKIHEDGPPSAGDGEKMAFLEAFVMKSFDDDAGDDDAILVSIAKGMRGVGDLAYAFDRIRDVQRYAIYEGKIEDDVDDFGIARRLGTLSEDLGGIMSDWALHEGQEATTLTDIDDMRFRPPYPYGNGETVIIELPPESVQMSEPTGDMAKRAKSKAFHVAKAAGHMDECIKCHGIMGKCIKSLHEMHKAHALSAKAAAATGVAKAGDFDHTAALTHLHDAMAAHLKAHEHADMAHSHLSLCAGEGLGPGDSGDGWTEPGGIHGLGSHGPTEGAVPGLNDGTGPTPGKAATATTFTKEHSDALVEAAYWKGQAEALGKLPAQRGGAVPITFDTSKANTMNGTVASGKTMQEALLEGVMPVTDQKSAATAAGKMIGNMVANGFGKNPITDPTFRGQAG